MVQAVRRLKDDVHALDELTKSKLPPCLLARPGRDAMAALMFGDASGEGYGSSLWKYGGQIVNTIHGIWTRAYGARSSNFRELYNLVLRVEQLVQEGVLVQGTELFIFTDNSTAESGFYRGTSSSKLLFDLVSQVEETGNEWKYLYSHRLGCWHQND